MWPAGTFILDDVSPKRPKVPSTFFKCCIPTHGAGKLSFVSRVLEPWEVDCMTPIQPCHYFQTPPPSCWTSTLAPALSADPSSGPLCRVFSPLLSCWTPTLAPVLTPLASVFPLSRGGVLLSRTPIPFKMPDNSGETHAY